MSFLAGQRSNQIFATVSHRYHRGSVIVPLFLAAIFLIPGLLSTVSDLLSAIPVTEDFVAASSASFTSDALPETETKTAEDTIKTPEKSSFELKNSYQSTPKQQSTAAAQKSQNSATLTSASTQAPQGNYMILNGRNLSIFRASYTTVDAGSKVALYGSKFYYGHRSAAFSGLASLGVGSTFTIALDGSTANYRVAKIVTLNHSVKDANGKSEVDRHMNALVQGRYSGGSYDAVLMTCAGTSLGGGDATDRLVVFANKL